MSVLHTVLSQSSLLFASAPASRGVEPLRPSLFVGTTCFPPPPQWTLGLVIFKPSNNTESPSPFPRSKWIVFSVEAADWSLQVRPSCLRDFGSPPLESKKDFVRKMREKTKMDRKREQMRRCCNSCPLLNLDSAHALFLKPPWAPMAGVI